MPLEQCPPLTQRLAGFSLRRSAVYKPPPSPSWSNERKESGGLSPRTIGRFSPISTFQPAVFVVAGSPRRSKKILMSLDARNAFGRRHKQTRPPTRHSPTPPHKPTN